MSGIVRLTGLELADLTMPTQILPFVDEQALALYLDFETAVYASKN